MPIRPHWMLTQRVRRPRQLPQPMRAARSDEKSPRCGRVQQSGATNHARERARLTRRAPAGSSAAMCATAAPRFAKYFRLPRVPKDLAERTWVLRATAFKFTHQSWHTLQVKPVQAYNQHTSDDQDDYPAQPRQGSGACDWKPCWRATGEHHLRADP